VLVNVLWGISFPSMTFINRLMEQAGPNPPGETPATAPVLLQVNRASFYTAVRFALALPLLAALIPGLFRRPRLAEWLMGAGVGLPFACGFLLQVAGLNGIPASRSGFLTSLSVVFTPLILVLVEHRRPRRRVVLGLAIAVLGTSVVTGALRLGEAFGPRPGDVASVIGLGDALTLAAAFLFAIQIVLIDVFGRFMPSARLTPGMFVAVVGVAVLTFIASQAASPQTPPLSSWLDLLTNKSFLSLTLITSLLCTVLAFFLMNKYQGFLPPSYAALIYTSEPVFATLWAMLLPDLISPWVGVNYKSERPGVALAVGGLLIILSNVIVLGLAPTVEKKSVE